MTVAKLLEVLEEHIKQALVNHNYIDSQGKERAVTVCRSFLKQREIDDEEYERYVIIRPINGTINYEESRVMIRFIIGAMDTDTDEGWLTSLNLLECIKQSILKKAIIGNKFTYDKELKWTFDEEEAYPMSFAYLDVPFIINNINYEDLDL